MLVKINVIVLVLFYNFSLQKADKDSLIDDIWGPEEETTPASVTLTPRNPDLEITTPSSKNCECVPYYLCTNGTINENGEDLIDIRTMECDHYLDTCCGEESITEKPTPTPPPEPKACGYRNPNGVGFRIQNAVDGEAEFGEFPWMVAIFIEERFEGRDKNLVVYQCGGALIHPQVVLTAAHCVKDKRKQFKVRAGEWDTQTQKELFPFQDREISTITIHPKFYAGALHNDVALVFLKKPVDLHEHINVVCLPPQDAVIDNSRCFSSGWGKDSFGKEGKYQVILKKIELPIVPRKQCQKDLRETRLGKYFQLHKSFVCAGGEAGKDTCKGDGGSPLVCPIQGQLERYFQVGIVAWGIGCGGQNVPGVYANVPLFRNWIDQQLKQKNFDIKSYQD